MRTLKKKRTAGQTIAKQLRNLSLPLGERLAKCPFLRTNEYVINGGHVRSDYRSYADLPSR